MPASNSRKNNNTETNRRFLWEAGSDGDSLSATSARTRTSQRSGGFSTRDYVVDQSVNLMDIAEGVPLSSAPRDRGKTASNTGLSSTISGLFRGTKEVENTNLSRFDEYGDAAPMADSEEYIDNDKRRRAIYVWGACRKALCSKYTLTLAVSLLGFILILNTLVLTVETEESERKGAKTNVGGTGSNSSSSNNNNEAANPQRYNKIRTRIVGAGVTPQELFESGSSPQQSALEWLVLEDPANLEYDHPALLDRYGLAVFYYSSNNASKKSFVGGWTNSENWMTGTGICAWHGVECVPREQEATAENDYTPFTKTYDGNDRVTGIRLDENNVEGRIPDEFSALGELLILDVEDNKLSHTLPAALGSLPKLRDLLVRGNALVGTLPAEYGDLAELHQLNLAHNQFEGPIPDGWSPKLTKLRYFSVGRNMLTGTFPNFSKMPRMTGLFLEDNNFEGNLPEWLGNLTGLLDLRIGKNKFGGPITALTPLQNLETLYIDNNLFTGSIPDMFDHLFRLHELVMQKNKFEGSIPLTLTHLQTLRTLNLASNQLGGAIPAGLGLLTDIVKISLDHNRFEGAIPTLLGRLDDITDLVLSHNSFSGTIPTELGECFRLKHLQLQHNALTGDVPPQLGELTGLTSLRLESNKLAGTASMPSQVCALRDNEELQVLCVDEQVSCDCCTDIPKSPV